MSSEETILSILQNLHQRTTHLETRSGSASAATVSPLQEFYDLNKNLITERFWEIENHEATKIQIKGKYGFSHEEWLYKKPNLKITLTINESNPRNMDITGSYTSPTGVKRIHETSISVKNASVTLDNLARSECHFMYKIKPEDVWGIFLQNHLYKSHNEDWYFKISYHSPEEIIIDDKFGYEEKLQTYRRPRFYFILTHDKAHSTSQNVKLRLQGTYYSINTGGEKNINQDNLTSDEAYKLIDDNIFYDAQFFEHTHTLPK